MNPFPLPLEIRDEGDGRNYRLVAPLEYETEVCSVRIPAGFATDFASIPRILWRVFPPMGIYNRAAVVHDYLYRTGCASRAVADAIFLDAMQSLGVPAWKRTLMYWGVRLGGRSSYRGKRGRRVNRTSR